MKIKDICTSVTDGSHNPPQGIEKSEYMMLSSKNVFDDEITFDEPRFLSEKDFEREYTRTKVAVGDVLLTIVGTVGRAATVDEDMPAFTLQRSVAVLHPKSDVCLPRFLMYALRRKRTYIENRAKGVAQKGIYLKEVSDIDIPIPDISNQEIIINKLDKVKTILKHRQKEVLALDNLIKARFVEMFGNPVYNEKGWETKPLLEMGKCKNGMNFRYDESGVVINCLGVGDFKDLSIIGDTTLLPTVSLNEMPSEEYLLKNDDIVFVRSNGNKALVGRSVAVYPEDTPTTFSGFCIRYRKDDQAVTIPYLLRVLKTDSIRMKMIGRGANIQNLNQQILRKLVIPIPPIELQNQFADFVHQVDKSKVAVQKALDETQLLFNSLMQEYFG